MLRRKAVLPYHWPTMRAPTSVIATWDSAFAAFSWPAVSGAATHSPVSRVASALLHQPNQPCLPRPLIRGCVAGVLREERS
jgi:hypothetical protein